MNREIDQKILIESLAVIPYTLPPDFPETDGTIEWNSTNMVLIEIKAANKTGIGYTYAAFATADFIIDSLKEIVIGKNLFSVESITQDLIHAIRNQGTCGIAMMAVSAIDS